MALFISRRSLESKLIKIDKDHKEKLVQIKDSLVQVNEVLKQENTISVRTIDSLQKVKYKIQYKYVVRKEQINSINDIDSLRLLLTARYELK